MIIDKYNEKCREIIKHYSGQWTPVFDSIGRLTSEDHYKTMDNLLQYILQSPVID